MQHGRGAAQVAVAQQQTGRHQQNTEQNGAPGIVDGDHLKHQPGERAVGARFAQDIQGRCRCRGGGNAAQQQSRRQVAGDGPDRQDDRHGGQQRDGQADNQRFFSLPEIPRRHSFSQQKTHHRQG